MHRPGHRIPVQIEEIERTAGQIGYLAGQVGGVAGRFEVNIGGGIPRTPTTTMVAPLDKPQELDTVMRIGVVALASTTLQKLVPGVRR